MNPGSNIPVALTDARFLISQNWPLTMILSIYDRNDSFDRGSDPISGTMTLPFISFTVS
jgi:hypothetical protein